MSLSENNEDEYDGEVNSDDVSKTYLITNQLKFINQENFIADDATVEKELMDQQKRERKKMKKKQKRQISRDRSRSSQELDDEDLEIIHKNKIGGRKLKKMGANVNASSDEENNDANYQIPLK